MDQYLENNRAALGVNDNVTDFSEYIEVKGVVGPGKVPTIHFA